MSMLFKRIKDWATTITAFRPGDVIPVDGPSGTAKMSKDDLISQIAESCGVVYITPATTLNEVVAIVSSGKLPVMQVVAGQGYNYFYPSWIGSGLTFVHIGRYGVVIKMWDDQVGGWTDVAGYDTTLSSDSKNAVQNAALYAVIGNVETLLAAL